MAMAARFQAAELFSQVGKLANAPDVVGISNWTEAIRSLESDEWDSITHDAWNDLMAGVNGVSSKRFQKWNDIGKAIDAVLLPVMDAAIEHVSQSERVSPEFSIIVRRDVRLACIEAEYSDIFKPGLHRLLATWYLAGHLPCGWRGEWPVGSLIVF